MRPILAVKDVKELSIDSSGPLIFTNVQSGCANVAIRGWRAIFNATCSPMNLRNPSRNLSTSTLKPLKILKRNASTDSLPKTTVNVKIASSRGAVNPDTYLISWSRQTVCEVCLHDELTSQSICDECGTRCLKCKAWDKEAKRYLTQPCTGTCGFREVVFQGDDTLEQFGSWLFSDQNKDATVLAHNKKVSIM